MNRILVGEDNAVARRILEALLEDEGRHCTLAATAAQVLDALRKDSFDLLLLDYRLDQTTDQVINQIHQSEGLAPQPGLKIYILSAEPAEEIFEKMKGVHYDGYLAKPISKDTLVALLNNGSVESSTLAPNASHQIDLSHLESLIGPDFEKIKRIVTSFLSESESHLTRIGKLIDERNWAELQNAVHKARSGFGYLGLKFIHTQLVEWEREIPKQMTPEAHRLRFENIKRDSAQAHLLLLQHLAEREKQQKK